MTQWTGSRVEQSLGLVPAPWPFFSDTFFDARFPSSTLFPFFGGGGGVSILELNSRKKGTLLLKGYWGT